jgi:hypothetical protein
MDTAALVFRGGIISRLFSVFILSLERVFSLWTSDRSQESANPPKRSQDYRLADTQTCVNNYTTDYKPKASVLEPLEIS